jgi:hypothetical protein
LLCNSEKESGGHLPVAELHRGRLFSFLDQRRIAGGSELALSAFPVATELPLGLAGALPAGAGLP